jgi:hypothetical protein
MRSRGLVVYLDLAKIVKVSGLLICLMLPATVFAQRYDNPGLGQKPVVAHPQDYKPLGVRAGSFMLHPGIQFAAEFTDNAFYTREDKQSDTIYHIRPYITAQSTWSRHSLNVSLAADIARHDKYGFRDYEDYFLTVNGRVDVKNRSYFSYGAQYMNLHEGLDNRDSEQGFEPTRYDLYGANVGYDHTFNRLSLGAGLTWARMNFDNAYAIDGDVIDNQDRDRDVLAWNANAAYQFKADMAAFIAYSGNKTTYDEPLDRNGYDRSGNGWAVTSGMRFTLTGKLNGDINAGYRARSYGSPELPDTSGWGFGGGLAWTPTYMTSVYGRFDSAIQDTTDENSSGYLRNLYSVRVDHELTRFLQLNGFASYSNNEYQLIESASDDARSQDKIYRAGVGLNWFINRHLYLNASYDWAKLTTDAPEQGYTVNRVWLTLGLER